MAASDIGILVLIVGAFMSLAAALGWASTMESLAASRKKD